MTASTVTVGTTTYLFPAPLIANYETKPNQVLAATSGPYSYLPHCYPFLLYRSKKNPQFIQQIIRRESDSARVGLENLDFL